MRNYKFRIAGHDEREFLAYSFNIFPNFTLQYMKDNQNLKYNLNIPPIKDVHILKNKLISAFDYYNNLSAEKQEVYKDFNKKMIKLAVLLWKK